MVKKKAFVKGLECIGPVAVRIAEYLRAKLWELREFYEEVVEAFDASLLEVTVHLFK